jgi:hypothetical protein
MSPLFAFKFVLSNEKLKARIRAPNRGGQLHLNEPELRPLSVMNRLQTDICTEGSGRALDSLPTTSLLVTWGRGQEVFAVHREGKGVCLEGKLFVSIASIGKSVRGKSGYCVGPSTYSGLFLILRRRKTRRAGWHLHTIECRGVLIQARLEDILASGGEDGLCTRSREGQRWAGRGGSQFEVRGSKRRRRLFHLGCHPAGPCSSRRCPPRSSEGSSGMGRPSDPPQSGPGAQTAGPPTVWRGPSNLACKKSNRPLLRWENAPMMRSGLFQITYACLRMACACLAAARRPLLGLLQQNWRPARPLVSFEFLAT